MSRLREVNSPGAFGLAGGRYLASCEFCVLHGLIFCVLCRVFLLLVEIEGVRLDGELNGSFLSFE